MLKDATAEQLIQALEDILQKGYHFTDQTSLALVHGIQHPTRKVLTSLPDQLKMTERQKQILELICAGHTAASIAKQLFISRRTVEGHWRKLFEKTGTHNVVGLVSFATQKDLLKRPS
ncbi:hypothetical protein GCM10023185_33100 [Hymenobacter saemangeumensis]|uniref:HTH luxR-type domain-containing protein n=1 Tax=Hymenobacter saemangeumensis TaxID=1084522 RepID=A0ABP8IN56_9BACT